MRRVKSTSDLPKLATVTEEEVADTISAPISPVSGLLSRSASSSNLLTLTEQTPQPHGVLTYISIKNPFPYALRVLSTYVQVTDFAQKLEPLNFEQEAQPGWQAINPINHHIRLNKTPFVLTSVKVIDPRNTLTLKEIPARELQKSSFLIIDLEQATTPSAITTSRRNQRRSNVAPRRLPRPTNLSTKEGIHVSPGQSRPATPSVLSPAQAVSSTQSSTNNTPHQTSRPESPYHTLSTPRAPRRPTSSSMNLFDLPTNPPADK
jgi:hypothetical protein